MEAVGYLAAAGMGVTLGLLGGGGSILAVPILVYLLGVPGAQATYHSLFIVGLSAAVGAVVLARRGLVAARTGLRFFVPSVLGVWLARRVLLPAVPPRIELAGHALTKDILLLALFGAVMLAAAASMLRAKRPETGDIASGGGRSLGLATALAGAGVGLVTGFVGAGGGFLIVPALTNGLRLPMPRAVGTSLFVIALNSLSGFSFDLLAGQPTDWPLIARFSAAALAGIVGGTWLSQWIPGARLKPAFGWFVLIAGTAMIARQVIDLS